MADVPEVLFMCTHNAGRSQMAAALLAREAAGQVRVTSAAFTRHHRQVQARWSVRSRGYFGAVPLGHKIFPAQIQGFEIFEPQFDALQLLTGLIA
jgi:hypothetical protein